MWTSDLFQNYDGKDTCDKPYTYDICGKGLSHNSNLQNHIRTHTGNKPHIYHIYKVYQLYVF
jgi:uncharacterized Zn-finger protein